MSIPGPAAAPAAAGAGAAADRGRPGKCGIHVSVVVPARDCASLLADCLAAIDAQTYCGPLDITVALAPGSDGTAAVLAEMVSGASLRHAVRVVDNPAGTTSCGLNAAVAASAGTVVARVDAQSRLPPDYIARAVATLAATGAANVGGVQRPLASDAKARAIAAALASPFGGGPARFRRGNRQGPADTVYLGVFDRAALDSVGGFDETLERNQDYELNWRLRERGHTVWLDPRLVVGYVPRDGFASLARQYFAYGAWKRTVLLLHPRSLRLRQLAAPALVAGLAASAVGLARGRAAGLAAPVAYTCASALAAARLEPAPLPEMRGQAEHHAAAAARLEPARLSACDRLRAAAAFAVMHLCWGAGFLAGPARKPGAQAAAGAARAQPASPLTSPPDRWPRAQAPLQKAR